MSAFGTEGKQWSFETHLRTLFIIYMFRGYAPPPSCYVVQGCPPHCGAVQRLQREH